ncbi:hypothetical protein COOONC_08592 [Cooperia oncophora]
MRRHLLVFVILCTIPAFVVLFFKTNEISSNVWSGDYTPWHVPPFTTQINCSVMLEMINPPFRAFLIDTSVLQSLDDSRCEIEGQRIQLAVDVGLLKTIRKGNYVDYDIIHYETPSYKDYFRIYDAETRIVPRVPLIVSGNLSIPRDIKRFLEAWKRSKFVECLGLNMRRTLSRSYLPPDKTVKTMSSLVKYLTSFDIYPFLNGGTLLGESEMLAARN